MNQGPEIRPASTVILLRDSNEGIETLLLKRNKALVFAGGFWVFPGGSLDPEDLAHAGGDQEAASRIAAAREAHEECGQQPLPEDMILLSHWTTPEAEPRRFATWIYAAPLRNDEEVKIDGGEIHDHRWLTVSTALEEHRHGNLAMLPPTWMTLITVGRYTNVAEFIEGERESPVPYVLPVLCSHEDKMVALYQGDAGYDAADPSQQGARHRAQWRDDGWDYAYEGVSDEFPPLLEQV
ncbi:NUDIX hydrolase [Halioglobus maricola]|uniref:NUDIX hydrolase n=1 Tax=Halioglobus maricola TaxID=2601894 RepID=A0A5P9NI73_9GAMM|nr:NUDIX hydrolase [Halioglobus maricola]QFU75492.1 NUDIX hydrolase [Halioglobus maricola]